MEETILVTGATGFLGRHLVPVLEEEFGKENVKGVCSRDFDLTEREQVEAMFERFRPDVVVHLAAYSGGIAANKKFQADFFHVNNLLMTHTFREAARRKVKKLVFPIAGCGYPSDAPTPIEEDMLWKGFPQGESAGYSMAKKMGAVASLVYRNQYGLDSSVPLPGNMYGEYDNFKKEESHVIPALVRRFHETILEGRDSITIWGTGNPVRDFVYAGDVARTFPFFIREHHSSDPVNISSGRGITIKELAAKIAELTGFQGEIHWDTTKPDGQMVKIFSVERMRSLGLECPTPLEEGLARTIAWFKANYETRGDGIRL